MSSDFSLLHLDKQLCFPLYAASRLTTQAYGPLLAGLDLTYPQYLVMLVLWQHGALPVNDIAKKLHLETNTVTPLLKRLEAKKLVVRKRSAKDERSVEVSPTPTGEALKAQAQSVPDQLMNLLQDESLSLAEIKAFQKTLNKMVEVLHSKLTSR